MFNFLELEDPKEDEVGKLVSCTLRCCLCPNPKRWGYTKSGKGAGSTGNMNAHMESKHGAIWAEAKCAEKLAAGVALDDNEQPSIASMFSSVSAHHIHLAGTSVLRLHQVHITQSFNLDTLHEKIVKWITISNQPFSEIESEELLDIFSYLRSAVEGRIIKADALKNRIKTASDEQRERFKSYIKVSTPFPLSLASIFLSPLQFQSIPGLMPIALDAWTSSNRIAFLAIVGTFITEDWRMEEVLLDFIEMHGAHDGKNMADCLCRTVVELDLRPKVSMVNCGRSKPFYRSPFSVLVDCTCSGQC